MRSDWRYGPWSPPMSGPSSQVMPHHFRPCQHGCKYSVPLGCAKTIKDITLFRCKSQMIGPNDWCISPSASYASRIAASDSFVERATSVSFAISFRFHFTGVEEIEMALVRTLFGIVSVFWDSFCFSVWRGFSSFANSFHCFLLILLSFSFC